VNSETSKNSDVSLFTMSEFSNVANNATSEFSDVANNAMSEKLFFCKKFKKKFKFIL
jgi:hypothetical protein